MKSESESESELKLCPLIMIMIVSRDVLPMQRLLAKWLTLIIVIDEGIQAF